jgi:thiol-disulfide isomerase/thioredoxin
MKKRPAVIFLAVLLLVITASGCTNTETAAVGKARGGAASSVTGQSGQDGDSSGYAGFTFSTYDIDGNLVDQSVFDYDGITMINFWASWCSPCMSELASLQQLNEEGVVKVIGVIVNDTEHIHPTTSDDEKKA